MARWSSSRKVPVAPRPALTHFLCLPLINTVSRPQIEASLNHFRQDVSPSLISPKAVRPVGAIHCTLGVMSLNHDRLQEAIQTLAELNIDRLLEGARTTSTSEQQTAQPGSAASKGIRIRLKGLASMHEPDHTSILYVPPDDENQALYTFCQAIQKVFQDRDLLVKDDRSLKLHATIVNTIYAKEKKPRYNKSTQTKSLNSQIGSTSSEEHMSSSLQAVRTQQSRSLVAGSTDRAQNTKSLLKFDARTILDKYQDHTWADDFILDRIAICEMGAKKKFDAQGQLTDEEYTEVAQIALPN